MKDRGSLISALLVVAGITRGAGVRYPKAALIGTKRRTPQFREREDFQVPDQPPPRRRFRLLRWSLFGLALVGLGFLLDGRLAPQPRSTISVRDFGCAFLSRDGKTIFTGPILREGSRSVECPCQAWDTNSGLLLETFLEGKSASQFKLSPSLRFLALQPAEGVPGEESVTVINLEQKSQTRLTFKGNSKISFSFSPRETFLLAYQSTRHSGCKQAYLLDLVTGKVVQTFEKVFCFDGFACNDRFLLFSTKMREEIFFDLHIWDTRTRQLMRTLPTEGEVVLSPDGRMLAVKNSDGWMLMNLANNRILLAPPKGPAYKKTFSPDSKTLASFLHNGTLELRDVDTGKPRILNAKWRDPQNDVLVHLEWDPLVAFSPDSTMFLMSCPQSEGFGIGLFDVASESLLWQMKLDHEICELRFTEDSRFLICNPIERAQFEVIEARSGERLRTFTMEDYSSWEFTPGSQFVTVRTSFHRQPSFLEKILGDWASSKNDAGWGPFQARVAESVTGREWARLMFQDLQNAWLSPDGQTLVTQHSQDDRNLLRVWDLPLRPPLRLVIGIPLGLGLLVLLFTRWRARRRGRAAAATVGPVASRLEQVQ